MSDYQANTGILEKITFNKQETDKWIDDFFEKKSIKSFEGIYDSKKEYINSEYYKDYIIIDDFVFKYEQNIESTDMEMSVIHEISKNKFMFSLLFYNGGTSQTEMLEEAYFKNLKNE